MHYYKIVKDGKIIGFHCGEEIPQPENGWIEISEEEYLKLEIAAENIK